MYREWLTNILAGQPRGTKARLAEHIGIDSDKLSKILSGTRDISAEELREISDFFGEEPPGFPGGDMPSLVPLMGYVGAGAEVEPDFEQVPDDGLDQIEVPFHLPADMIALQVKGDSMLPMFDDGMVIIVFREQRRATETFYGERAVVRTGDGRRFIKTIIKGDGTGRVSLLSWNAQPIQNVEPIWIGEIFTFFPASAIRRTTRQVSRQGGIQGQLKLKTA